MARRIRSKDIFIDYNRLERNKNRIKEIKRIGTITLLIEFLINNKILMLKGIAKTQKENEK